MSKMITNLYAYDSTQEANNYRGTDYSKYILIGDSDVDNLDDTLDTVELTLAGLPFREEFAPGYKFIYEKWDEQLNNDGVYIPTLVKSIHLCVSNDTVEQPIISDNNYFNHSLSLIEASVDAQSRLVDNIAVTYRLKDVTLESTPTYDTTAKAIKNQINVENYPSENFGLDGGRTNIFTSWANRRIGHAFKWIMPDWYQVEIDGVTKTPSWDDWNNFLLNQEIPSGQISKTVSLPVPMLECLCAVPNTKTFRHNGYCSIEIMVEQTVIATNTKTTVTTLTVNPNQNDTNELWTPDEMLPELSGYGWIESRCIARLVSLGAGGQKTVEYYHTRTQVATPVTSTVNRVLTFTINSGCSYTITLRRKELNPGTMSSSNYNPTYDYDNYNDKYDTQPAYHSYAGYTENLGYTYVSFDNRAESININYPLLTMNFNAVLAGTDYSIYLRNAPTENAYNLFNKSQLTTQNINKINGIPVDETPKTFYLEDADVQQLQNTTIVENFYNQKNLWEIFMDIGKFIHARPLVRFGSDNRYVVTWKKYGRTDQYEDNGNTINIYNSRFIEEYISSLSSYVSNMVQLGGLITEIVAPKSSSDDYLVYNDVAEIIVSKNIIELVDLDVIRKSDGQTRNLVGKGTHGESTNGFVFEENVYNILSINANDSVNKGLAIYYQLGTNKIVGLNYRLPTINTGDADNDYAIKRIIGTVFQMTANTWKNIKINDYLFKISYRTKDTLRSNQTRPDLRKYLLASKYDKIPQHNQFNNQQDIVVDSVKFGNNVYGKLIRTGNKVYTKLEWVDNLLELKKSGDLYNIDDELYYVSKVKNTYYSDHIESEVEFSKDFNRLSQIIGIPSEPRFYEISEQSLIKREIALDDYIVLGTSVKTNSNDNSFIKGKGWEYIGNLLCSNETDYPKYAVSIFKNDIDKSTIVGNETFKIETCMPICTYSIENTLTIEWDMRDNFSAGDQVGATNVSFDPLRVDDTAYNTLIPYRYVDVYGRCDMMDFAIMKDHQFTNQQVMNLPANPIDFTNQTEQDNLLFSNAEISDYGSNTEGLIILKDNRESLSFNYNLQMLTDSDRFVLSAYMWQKGKENLRLGLLKDEINKISNSTIPNTSFATESIPFTYNIDSTYNNNIVININQSIRNYATANNITISDLMAGVKAIVLYSTNEINDYTVSGEKYFVFGRNIGGLTLNDTIPAKNALSDWYISNYDKNSFEKQ